MSMVIVIGSSRHDERGKYTGGKNGDQKQTAVDDYAGEVSMQTLASFIGSRKWYVLRPIKIEHAVSLAKAMKTACNNPHIGYAQDKRYGIITHGVDTSIDVGSDCSSTVRACIKKAMGKDVGDFNTASEKDILENSGLFFKAVLYKLNMTIYEGDVFVTQKKGHTGICIYGHPRNSAGIVVAKPTIKRGSKGEQAKILQQNLNRVVDARLDEDGDFGPLSTKALKLWQDSVGLVADGIYGPKSYDAMNRLLN